MLENSTQIDCLTDTEKELFMPNIDICFDWVQVTFQGIGYDDVIYNLFGIYPDRCTHSYNGKFGYNESFTVYSKCHVMINKKNPQMGVHVLFSGSACREYEQCFSWDYFFKACRTMNGKFTRIDIAIDCFKRYFTVNQLKNKIKKGELVSKFKKTTYIKEMLTKDGTQTSSSLKFGSMSSDIYIVIYDKLAERMNAGYTVASGVTFWTRCELRFKHDLSCSISDLYLNHSYDLSKFVFNVLYNYIDFKDTGKDKNRSRWQTSQFWKTFLGDCEKQEISVKAFQSTIQKKKEYAENCLNKLMAMLYVCDNDWIRDIIKNGFKRLTDHDLAIINGYMVSNNYKVITKEDILHMFDLNLQEELFKAVG